MKTLKESSLPASDRWAAEYTAKLIGQEIRAALKEDREAREHDRLQALINAGGY